MDGAGGVSGSRWYASVHLPPGSTPQEGRAGLRRYFNSKELEVNVKNYPKLTRWLALINTCLTTVSPKPDDPPKPGVVRIVITEQF